MARRRKSKIGKTGCLFWLFILLVIIVIFIYKDKGSFKSTINYFKNINLKEDKIISEKKEVSEEVNYNNKEEGAKVVKDNDISEKVIQHINEDTKEIKDTTSDTKTITPSINKLKVKKLNKDIYFVQINKSDGIANPVSVRRIIEYKDSPITRTIKTLLKGPTINEKQSGIISFIPDGTNLISAEIKNGHLILNFNSKFEENYSGREAILLEINQVVLTVFEFNDVVKLSILINGQKKSYLTGEGIPLKGVYTKSDVSEMHPDY